MYSEEEEPSNAGRIAGGLGAYFLSPLAGLPLGLLALNQVKDKTFSTAKEEGKYLKDFQNNFGTEIPKGISFNKSLMQARMRQPSFDPVKNNIHLEHADDAIALHELGHAKNIAGGNPVSQLKKWLIEKGQGALDDIGGGRPIRGVLKGHAANMGNLFVDPIEEALAWKNAAKMSKTPQTTRQMLKVGLPAYGSYLARSGVGIGGLALAGSGIYNAMTSED